VVSSILCKSFDDVEERVIGERKRQFVWQSNRLMCARTYKFAIVFTVLYELYNHPQIEELYNHHGTFLKRPHNV
jgi:hypothetical protein